MTDDLDNAICQNAEGAKRAGADGTSAEQHPLKSL